MDVEVFSFGALERAWKETRKPSDREHVTFYFWKNPDLFHSYRYDLKDNLSKYRLTVDYPEDFEVVKEIFTRLYPINRLFSLQDIVKFLKTNPEVFNKNANVLPFQGWKPSFEKDRQKGYL